MHKPAPTSRKFVVTHALRGLGDLLMLLLPAGHASPAFASAPASCARVVLFAGPGAPLRTTASHPLAESYQGWRAALWQSPTDALPVLEEKRPAEHHDIDLGALVHCYRSLGGSDVAEPWAHGAWLDAARGWCTILAPATEASAPLQEAALARLDDAFVDAGAAWGDRWVNDQITDRMRMFFAERRTALSSTRGPEAGPGSVVGPPPAPESGKRKTTKSRVMAARSACRTSRS
jgi:hypothetical protein